MKVTDLLKKKYQIYSNYILPTATQMQLATSLITYRSLSLQKKKGVGQNSYFLHLLKQIKSFYNIKSTTEVKRKTFYLINDKHQFRCLDYKIKNPCYYSIYHYASQTFHSLLLQMNKRLSGIYSTWYLISTKILIDAHLINDNIEQLDQRVVRLFFVKFGVGYLDLHEIIAPREESKLFISYKNNHQHKNYFSDRIRTFEKIFPGKEKITEYKKLKKNC